MTNRKVLLMGKAHSGKTSMRSIIFANYLAENTMYLSPTIDVERHHVRFLGNLALNLWDCGGQDTFYESYFERDRETIFRSVKLLIYVFDIMSDCPEKDFDHFAKVLEYMEENSPDARIFVLVHKMDLVPKEEQEMILDDRKRMVQETCGMRRFEFYGTSIWDESLYKAWSQIVRKIIPNIKELERHLGAFCTLCDADEVVLFERATFLIICDSQGHLFEDGVSTTSDTLVNNIDIPLNVTNTSTVTTTPEERYRNCSPTEIAFAAQNNIDLGTLTPVSTFIAENTREIVTESIQDFLSIPALSSDNENTSTAYSLVERTMPTSIDGTFNDSQIFPSAFSKVTEANSLAKGKGTSNNQHVGAVLSPTSSNANVSCARSNNSNQFQTKQQKRQNQQLKRRQRRQRQLSLDTQRFEKISNIVKQFKLSCEKAQSQFQSMEVSNSRFTACIDAFTANTYIMVILSHHGGSGGAWNESGMGAVGATTLLNIKNARSHFERFITMLE